MMNYLFNPINIQDNNRQNLLFNNISRNTSNNIFYDYNPFYVDEKLTNSQKSINIFNKKENKVFKEIKEESKEDKALLFFKSHNFTNEKEISKINDIINDDKKKFDNLSSNLEEEMKCVICLNRYKDPLLCPYCHHFFCKNCLETWYGSENKTNCVYCRKNMELKSFIEISSFKKILPFLDLIRENNSNYFSNKLNNNKNNVIVVCANKIHEENDEENKDKDNINDDISNNKNKDKETKITNLNEIKADYYCFDCNKPYCSDCICINDDYTNCEHNNDHAVFNIDLLKEIEIFDLLYENENNQSIEELEKLNKKIIEGIDTLNKNKNNMLLFINYIKNTYSELIDMKIDKLKDILKENENEINKIKNKFNDINNFIKNLKTNNDIKNINNINEIKNNLKILKNCNNLKGITEENISNILEFKGNLQVKEHINKVIELDKNNFDSKKYYLDYNVTLIIIDEETYNNKNKSSMNPFLLGDNYLPNNFLFKNDNKDKENNNNKLKLIIIYDPNNDLYNSNFNNGNINEKNKNIKNYFFYPFLFNNENKYILFDEIKEEDDLFLIKKELIKYKNSIFLSDKDSPSLSSGKKYFRTFVEIDNLIVNNDSNYKNIENKYSSKINKINLCIHSLNIY